MHRIMTMLRVPLYLGVLLLALTVEVRALGTGAPAAFFGVGFGADGQRIYRIDLAQGTSAVIRTLGSRDPAPQDVTSPNGLALDSSGTLLFYSLTRSGAADDEIYRVPVTGSAAPRLLGKLRGNVRAAAFRDGKYYYIRNGASTLREVSFSASGALAGDAPVCRSFITAIGDPRFGDITFHGNLLYGTVRDAVSRQQFLFQLNLDGCVYSATEIGGNAPPQLLVGTDGVLYAHDHLGGGFVTLNPATGAPTASRSYAPLVHLADLAGPSPNPGLQLVTRTNGTDNPLVGGGPVLLVGSPVEWTYEVTNSGAVPLTNLIVTDDRLPDDATQIDCDGDNVLDVLNLGETAICRATGTAEPGAYVNVGMVNALAGSVPVTATDDDRYVGYEQSAFLLIDDETFARGIKYHRTGGNVVSTSSFWTAADLGSGSDGKRSELPYARANRGHTITLVTGAVNVRGSSSGRGSSRSSAEAWFAPQCIPAAWLGRPPSIAGDCLEGVERDEALRNFILMGTTPWSGASPSIPVDSADLEQVEGILPLRARGLAGLQGKPVCAVVYDGDLEAGYSAEKAGAATALDNETLGLVAFEVTAVRTRTCAGSNTWCLPEVSVKLVDPAGPCASVGLLNAPVPRSGAIPTDTMVAPVFGEVDSMGYWSLEFAPGLGPVY